MLSPDEQGRVRDSIAGVARAASALLQQAATVEQALTVVMLLHRGLDKVVAAASDTPPAPECRPGCASCCSARVEVSEPEAVLIAEHLGGWPQQELDRVIAGLRVKAAQPAERRPCALLQDGQCSIYALRPAVCRKAHSLSAAACRSGAAQIPQNLALVVQCESLMAGTKQAFECHGLPTSRLELAAAVLSALSRDTARDRWYCGETLAPRDHQPLS